MNDKIYIDLQKLSEDGRQEVRKTLRENLDKVYIKDNETINFTNGARLSENYHLGYYREGGLWLSNYKRSGYKKLSLQEFKELFMKKQIFKQGDRVFFIGTGWGLVKDGGDGFVTVDFDNATGTGIIKPDLLSFTEYTLNNFSQERPIDYNDYVGKWGIFLDAGYKAKVLDCLIEYRALLDNKFMAKSGPYKHFKPLTEEQIKILELE